MMNTQVAQDIAEEIKRDARGRFAGALDSAHKTLKSSGFTHDPGYVTGNLDHYFRGNSTNVTVNRKTGLVRAEKLGRKGEVVASGKSHVATPKHMMHVVGKVHSGEGVS